MYNKKVNDDMDNYNSDEIMKEFNEMFGDKPSLESNNDIKDNADSFDDAMSNFVSNNSAVNVVPEVNVSNGVIGDVNNKQPIDNGQKLHNTSSYITNNNIPVENKKKKATVTINSELKTVALLTLVLLIAMAIVPTLYDLIDGLKIKIFG